MLAEHLVNTGKKIRLYTSNQDSKQTHPFTSALIRKSEEKGLHRYDVFQQIFLSAQFSNDGALARHCFKKANDGSLFYEQSLPKYATATRLILGDLDQGNFINPAHPGRLQDASKVIYNLVEDPSRVDAISREIIELTERFSKELQILNLRNKSQISDHAKLTQFNQPQERLTVIEQSFQENAKETARRLLMQQLLELHTSIQDHTEPQQWGRLWVDVFIDNGFPANEIFKKSIIQFIELHKKMGLLAVN